MDVPAIRLSHLTEAQKRAYVIADNKLAELAGWDQDLLALELQGLAELELDFDLRQFEHLALFNEATSSIEMHLRSKQFQLAHVRRCGLAVQPFASPGRRRHFASFRYPLRRSRAPRSRLTSSRRPCALPTAASRSSPGTN